MKSFWGGAERGAKQIVLREEKRAIKGNGEASSEGNNETKLQWRGKGDRNSNKDRQPIMESPDKIGRNLIRKLWYNCSERKTHGVNSDEIGGNIGRHARVRKHPRERFLGGTTFISV